MTIGKRGIRILVTLGLLVAVGLVLFNSCFYISTIKDYRDPSVRPDEVFADDPAPAQPPPFDSALVDSRKLGGWEVNSSAAVIRLDCPLLKPDRDGELLRLHPSYAASLRAADGHGEVLPSVNLLDGKAKQFDDGLYAAVDLAAFRGVEQRLSGCMDIVKRLQKLTGKKWPGGADEYLRAALALADGIAESPPLTVGKRAYWEAMLDEFFASQTDCQPIGFYTWSKELQTLWRTERFLALDLKLSVAADLAAALRSDPQLLADYRKFVGLFRGLTNPYECLSLDELPAGPLSAEALKAEAKKRGARHAAASFLPPSSSRENELAEKLWPLSGSDLMREMIARIRSGKVDLKPTKNSGWYDYQVYALETLLLPGKGEEKDKLVLSARYKQRMKEAFEALLTKRRETHARHLGFTGAEMRLPEPKVIRPQLRLEPNATYYLRTARAYAFVENLLVATFGEQELAALHGLRQENGKVANRSENLAAELAGMRALFYGCYLLSCEDLGLAPKFMEGESVDAGAAKAAAEKWLTGFWKDPDLAADTRVSVPVVFDESGTELWATIGVRLMRLEAEYVFPPSIRRPGAEDWRSVDKHDCTKSTHLIPVDAFVAFRLQGNRVLTREELRAALDQAGTKEKFLELMRKR